MTVIKLDMNSKGIKADVLTIDLESIVSDVAAEMAKEVAADIRGLGSHWNKTGHLAQGITVVRVGPNEAAIAGPYDRLARDPALLDKLRTALPDPFGADAVQDQIERSLEEALTVRKGPR